MFGKNPEKMSKCNHDVVVQILELLTTEGHCDPEDLDEHDEKILDKIMDLNLKFGFQHRFRKVLILSKEREWIKFSLESVGKKLEDIFVQNRVYLRVYCQASLSAVPGHQEQLTAKPDNTRAGILCFNLTHFSF